MTMEQQAGATPGSGAGRLGAAAAVARLAMGAVFVVAGLTKVWNPVLFYWEAVSYAELVGVAREAWPVLGRIAVGLGPLECALGLALIVNWRSRLVAPVGLGFLVVFLALTGLAWYRGSDVDCGCFGALMERTPRQASLEDLVMLGLLALAWRRGLNRWPGTPSPGLRQGAALAVILALATTAFRFYPESARLESSDFQPGVRLTGLELRGPHLDLKRGEHLLELFSPRCARCRMSVAKLNHWVDTPGLPPVVAVTMSSQDSEDLAEFVQLLRPRYPIASISVSDWRRLTWRHGYPRLALVRDGAIDRVWEYDEMPTARQLQELLGASSADR